MIKKDKKILKLIEKLKLSIDFSSVEVVDYWESDLCAIGLRTGHKLIYISVFNYVENDVTAYDFDLEIINDNKDSLQLIKEARNVSEKQLTNEIKMFFEI